MEAVLPSCVLKDEIYKLLEEKRTGNELDIGPTIPEIDDFITSQMARLDTMGRFEKDLKEAPVDKLNILFQDTLYRSLPSL